MLDNFIYPQLRLLEKRKMVQWYSCSRRRGERASQRAHQANIEKWRQSHAVRAPRRFEFRMEKTAD